ncbi:diguanylate cyclase [Pseudomonas syringae]|nr:diguanylate cyclase [Pseudomonas syringae]MBD8577826.1 diguanylate cyclase [Pseudomonas syringae]MBD8793326.1 diguanylate cyclase [Pseudomonas syringae]MBD8804086.1 diguanylate cyclase [Pseudomonas syringae]MBD8814860.1 diguanylate cyclase [Pseudomonas syringae]
MFKPTLARWIALRHSHPLIWRLLPAIAALSLLIGLGCYLLVKTALSQDADVQQRSRTFIARTIGQVRNEVGQNIINYSKWGEAYKHLHLKMDKVWADEQRNVGEIPYELYGYNGVFVIDAQDRTVYAVIDGKPASVSAADWLQGDLPALLLAAREADRNDTSVVQAFRVDAVAALAAASAITPGGDPAIQRTPGPASVMILVSILSHEKLAHLSETYGLPALTMSSRPLPDLQSMPLLDADIYLNWTPPTPGMHLLGQTLPVFMAGVLALIGVLTVLLRHAMASARQVEAQFAEIRHLSQHDFLTGLPNRYQLDQFLNHHLQRDDTQRLAVLSLDLDGFKPINDALGHAAGDRVLQCVAQRLRDLTPTQGMVARFGGDEFVMVWPHAPALPLVEPICAQIIEALHRPIDLATDQVVLGASVGLALAPQHAGSALELLRMSDVALYQAKSAGRNTWRVYSACTQAGH